MVQGKFHVPRGPQSHQKRAKNYWERKANFFDLQGLVDDRVSVEQQILMRSQILTGHCSFHRRRCLALHIGRDDSGLVRLEIIESGGENKTS